MDFEKVSKIVRRIQDKGNVHEHLDLIAGLPYEDVESFAHSFDDVYALKPEQLQLGFLKVLKGSFMQEHQEEYGIVHKAHPPYEVLYTKWISYEDVLRLKGIEEMVEVYYNSRQFTNTMEELEKEYDSAFNMYDRLASIYGFIIKKKKICSGKCSHMIIIFVKMRRAVRNSPGIIWWKRMWREHFMKKKKRHICTFRIMENTTEIRCVK